jgi:TRAP-type C4-dicarboxylate transport system permease large subunit
MFVVCSVAKISVEEFVREIMPFFLALLAVLFAITYIPGLVTWLPNAIFR